MTKGRRNPKIMPVNTGRLMENKLSELRITKAELARRINRPSTAILPMLSRHSTPAYVLWEVSLALDYDFFSDLSQALKQKQASIKSATADSDQVIAALQKELSAIKEERDYLKKMIDIMAKKI